MLQLNLLPDVKKEFLKAGRQRNLVMTISIVSSVIAGSVIVILGLVMGGQLVQKNLLLADVERDKKSIEQAKSDKQLNEYLTIQNQLGQIVSLKETQPIYSHLFDYLKQLNPASPNNVELNLVRIASASGGEGDADSIELQGSTSSFASLDVYKTTLMRTTITYSNGPKGDALTEPLFSTVTVSQAGIAQASDERGSRVAFTINLVYNPAAFKLSSTGLTLKIPQETTSDGDRNAPTFNSQSSSQLDSQEGEGGDE
jgi:hypothetical protein